MALGPDGTSQAPPLDALAGADEDASFVRGLEGVIDRALARHPRGETFLYGIHQELEPGAIELLASRYRAAGWAEVQLREGLTGAHNLILIP